ncbi:MAG TPA: hypothetical protein VER96_38840 [Polyangiaceae bacterium]|nr:hypothetical protein [Polyangiaceae bacterium]
MKRTSLGLPLLLTLLASAACSSKESNNTPAPGGGTSSGGTSSGGTTSTTGGTASGVSGSVSSGGSGTSTGGSATGGSSPDGTSGSPSTATGGTSSGGSPGTGGSAPVVCPTLPTAAIASKDIIQFNDDGGWCWYQDERVVVDTKAKKAVIGSVATGSARNGQPEAVIYDFATGMKTKYNLGGKLNPDDHNAPGFVVMPDGKYVAMWATHRDNCNSYYGVFDGTQWSSKIYDWTPNGCEWEAGMNPNSPHKITYANPWYLSSESKIFSAVRSISTSPAMLSSSDGGNTWSLYGRLTATPTVGYVAGYYKYWGNGTDRIDFVATQAHPRDDKTSLFHGYYKAGKLYDSTDKVVDDNAGDTTAQNIDKFTSIVAHGAMIKTPGGTIPLYRFWNHDIVRYDDGTIVVMGQGRADFPDSTPDKDGADPDKRLIYARWDGKAWTVKYLVKAGPKLYPDEQDYTGLGAAHPDNPNVIFLSSTFDPRTDMQVASKKHEIFMGVTCDGGATFQWAQLTENSTKDNLRPVVPRWDANHTFLLWERGDYNTAQTYATEIIGTTVLSSAAP